MLFVLDTSTEMVGMCLYDGVQVVAEQLWKSKNFHTVELVPTINRMFKQAGFHTKELTALGVALGPGSFTSLRIGLSVIKGLALPLNLPIVGMPSLDILAASQPAKNVPMLAILHLGRGRLASMRYQYQDGAWKSTTDLLVSDARELAKTIDSPIYICGEMDSHERQLLGRKWKTAEVAPASMCVRRPLVFAEMVWERVQNNQVQPIAELSPIYVHTLSNVPDL